MKQHQMIAQVIFDRITEAYGIENKNRLNAFCTRLALDIDEVYPPKNKDKKYKIPKHNCDLCGAKINFQKIDECKILCNNCLCERDEENNNT